jgi:myo-inositol-1(or 4)-monophosphatase
MDAEEHASRYKMKPRDAGRALRIAVDAARAAGDVLARGFSSSDKGAETKGHPHNPVTVYDRAAERAIIRALTAEYPDDGILSEESTELRGSSGLRWVIDPLDGTSNFLAGIPHFAVSIALAHGDGTVLGCVYDPLRGETFSARRGDGATLNHQPIRASERETLDGAVLGVGLSFHPDRRAKMIGQLRPFLSRAGVLRTLGSAALDLAYVAAGRLDAAWFLSLHPWDVAAGELLVEEAGGRVSDLAGAALRDPRDGIAASNGRIHDVFLDALR